MNKAGFRFYVSQKDRQISFNRGGKKQGYNLRNYQRILGRDGIDGVKTGKTNRAGDCLILSAYRESRGRSSKAARTAVIPRHLIVVMLGSTDRFGEGAATARARLAALRPVGWRRAAGGSEENAVIR